jgi:hypothetical protein
LETCRSVNIIAYPILRYIVHIAANIFYHGNDCVCLFTYIATCTEDSLEAFLHSDDYNGSHYRISLLVAVGGEIIFKIIKLY